MYVATGSACTERNSQTPMTADRVTRQNARVARVGNRFVRGNLALNTLVQQLGGVGIGENVPGVIELAQAADFRNAPGCDTAILGDGSLYGGRVANPSQAPGFDEGGAMLPLSLGGNVTASAALPGTPLALQSTTPATSLAAALAAAASPASPSVTAPAGSATGSGAVPASTTSGANGGWPGRGRRAGGPGGLSWSFPTRGASPFGRACAAPAILPMMSVFPIPSPGQLAPAAEAAPASSVRSIGPGSNVSPVTPAAPAMPGTAPKAPTTGNVCLDLALAYTLQSQVTPQQLVTCAQAGYQSNTIDGPLLTTAYQTWRNNNPGLVPKVPYQANPPAFTPQMAAQYGLGSLGQASNGGAVALALLAIGGLALWWAVGK